MLGLLLWYDKPIDRSIFIKLVEKTSNYREQGSRSKQKKNSGSKLVKTEINLISTLTPIETNSLKHIKIEIKICKTRISFLACIYWIKHQLILTLRVGL
jgi:hypothetical protein